MERAPATPSPATAWLDGLLERAVAAGVTDLHLEPDAGGLWVRLWGRLRKGSSSAASAG